MRLVPSGDQGAPRGGRVSLDGLKKASVEALEGIAPDGFTAIGVLEVFQGLLEIALGLPGES